MTSPPSILEQARREAAQDALRNRDANLNDALREEGREQAQRQFDQELRRKRRFWFLAGCAFGAAIVAAIT